MFHSIGNALDLEKANLEIASAINSSHYGERLMKILCRIGPRPVGSLAMRQAAEVLSKMWLELGAEDVHTEEVPVIAWNGSESQVELIAPIHHFYDSLQCINTASGTVEGKLFYAGRGDAEALQQLGDSVRGAVLLIKGHEISGGKYEPIQKRICLLQDAEVAGVILVSQFIYDLPAIMFMYTNNPVNIPVVGVSGKDGKILADLATNEDVRVRIRTNGQPRKATCLNLLAEIGPYRKSKDVIILSAHLDSHYVAPGAFDNLTGVITMTEIVRALAPFKRHFSRLLRIIAYTGEEYGFLGSKHYVRVHADDLDRIRFALNMDGLFDSTAEGMAVMWSPEMRDYIERALEKLHPEVNVRNHFCMSSDYLPFMLQGIPAGRPADWKDSFPLWGHTREDTDDKIPVAWLRVNAIVYARLLLKMLTDKESLPSKRKTHDQVRALLKQEDAEDIVLNWQDFSDFGYMGRCT